MSSKKNMNVKKSTPVLRDGRIYFSEKAERKFYFILTMALLVCGILVKAGLF